MRKRESRRSGCQKGQEAAQVAWPLPAPCVPAGSVSSAAAGGGGGLLPSRSTSHRGSPRLSKAQRPLSPFLVLQGSLFRANPALTDIGCSGQDGSMDFFYSVLGDSRSWRCKGTQISALVRWRQGGPGGRGSVDAGSAAKPAWAPAHGGRGHPALIAAAWPRALPSVWQLLCIFFFLFLFLVAAS